MLCVTIEPWKHKDFDWFCLKIWPDTGSHIILREGCHNIFRSITMLCGTNNILQNILYIQTEWWNILYNIVSPQNNVMDMNNVMAFSRSYSNKLQSNKISDRAISSGNLLAWVVYHFYFRSPAKEWTMCNMLKVCGSIVGTSSNSTHDFGCWIRLEVVLPNQQLRVMKTVFSSFKIHSWDANVVIIQSFFSHFSIDHIGPPSEMKWSWF